MSITLSALSGRRISVAGSGAVLLPSDMEFVAASDWEAIVVEGAGSITAGTKTATGFTCVVTVAPCSWLVCAVHPPAVAHID